MKVKIRTWQKCKVCGGAFTATANALICLTCQTIPTKYFLEWWYSGERYYWPPLNSFFEAQRKAVQIEYEIKNHDFKIENYKGASTRVNKKFQFSHLYAEWLQGKEKAMQSNLISPAYYDLLCDYKALFSAYFKDTDIRLIKTYEINKFFEHISEREVSSKNISTGRKVSLKTKKNIMGILRKFFCDMLDLDLITELPKFPKITIQEQELSWIDAATQARIFSELPAADKPIFEFLKLTGLRPAEARALKWSCIVKDAEIPYINIKASFSDNVYREITKVKKIWQIPIRKQIAELLKSIPRSLISQFVFIKNGKPYHDKRIIKIWNAACERAGVKISMYQGLRHSWASQRLNEGVSLTVIGASMGHTNPTTTRRYAHLDRLKAIRAELGE